MYNLLEKLYGILTYYIQSQDSGVRWVCDLLAHFFSIPIRDIFDSCQLNEAMVASSAQELKFSRRTEDISFENVCKMQQSSYHLLEIGCFLQSQLIW